MSKTHFNPMDPFRVLVTSETEEWIEQKSFSNMAGAKRSVTTYLKRNPNHTAKVITREESIEWHNALDAEIAATENPDESTHPVHGLIDPSKYEVAEVVNTLHEKLTKSSQYGKDKPIISIPENILNYITRGATLSIKESWKRIAVKMYGEASVNAALK
jgi:hypothetical protein